MSPVLFSTKAGVDKSKQVTCEKTQASEARPLTLSLVYNIK